MAQALFDEHPLGDYLRGSYIPSRPLERYKNHIIGTDNGETPLLIPGIYPALEQELVDLIAGHNSNSSGDYKEWLPRVLLDFIEVSLLLSDLGTHIGLYRRKITFAVTVSLNNSSHIV